MFPLKKNGDHWTLALWNTGGRVKQQQTLKSYQSLAQALELLVLH